jgi:hypothetical protein
MSQLKSLFLTGSTLVLAGAVAWLSFQNRGQGYFTIDAPDLPRFADGRTPIQLHAMPHGRALEFASLTVRIVEGQNRAAVQSVKPESGAIAISIRPGIIPGKIALEIDARRFAPVRTEFITAGLTSDQFHDGTPDFLRLGSDDESAFRNWFTYLAESQYFRTGDKASKEINDCAALIRFAYRETLRTHDARWANDQDLDEAISFPSVEKYQYPYTPLGAALFRIRIGSFRWDDLAGGAFAQFADARTLQQFNTHLISRNVNAAQRGDLLFYRQLDQNMPFHGMIFVGPSHFDSDSSPRIVYHTGPIAGGRGEIRRPTVDQLLHHPEPKWRPVPANSNFLGVYRWNILR